ncbi:hypothetical protein TRFO_29489 [Tritrichomonas foetus]|uniref:Guanylate cyclase domain-containing protein n=1 Tax=Tritrichomonas foetus TaxID=1144522 RepID=A0A1J4K162_9EUKA|nr:hypothetical protein TRFO_29489 [Tritrichomonas foetus]|eukprot:OHT03229.1 hypothetical protein TRFO_29489 [Tritrichomonas foetus]
MNDPSLASPKKIKDGHATNIFSSRYLFFENVARQRISSIFFKIQIFIMCLQIIFMWTMKVENLGVLINVYESIFNVLLITKSKISKSEIFFIGGILNTIIFGSFLFILLSFFLFEFFSFQNKVLYYIINIIISIISPLLIIPLSHYITLLIFLIYYEGFTTGNTVFLVYEIINYLLSILLSIMSRLLLSNSPYNLFYKFQNYHFFIELLIFLPSIFSFIRCIFEFFPFYTTYIVYSLEIAFYAVFLFYILYSPPASCVKFSIISSMCFSKIVFLLAIIIMLISDTLNQYVFISIICLFIVGCFIFAYFYKTQEKLVLKFLSFNGVSNIVTIPLEERVELNEIGNRYDIEDRLDQYFTNYVDDKSNCEADDENNLNNLKFNNNFSDNINIANDKSARQMNSSTPSFNNYLNYINQKTLIRPHKAFWILLVGLRNACDLIIDGSFQRYLFKMENFDIKFARILALCSAGFLDERKFMLKMIQYISLSPSSNKGDIFLLYQLKRLNASRQTALTENVDVGLNLAIFESRQLELGMKRFWLQPKLSAAHLYNASKLISKGKTIWQNISSATPNMIQVLEEELRFSVEAVCDFQTAISKKRRIDLLNEGHIFAKDNGFLSLVNSFPLYIKKSILRIDGSNSITIGNNEKGDLYFSKKIHHTGESSTLDYNSFDFENSENIEVAKKLFTHPKTRLSIYAATKGMKPKMSFTLVLFNIIWSLILVLSISIFGGYLYSYFDKDNDYTYLLDYVRLSRQENSISNLGLLLKYLQTDDPIKFWAFSKEYNDSQISENYFYLNQYDMIGSIVNHSYHSLQYLSLITQYLRIVKENRNSMDLEFLDNFLKSDIASCSVCKNGDPIYSVPMNFKSAMINDIINTLNCINTDADYLRHNNHFCAIYSAYQQLSGLWFSIRTAIYEATIEKNSQLGQYNNYFVVTIPCFYFVIIISIYIPLLILLYKEVNTLAQIMISTFSESEKKEGSNKISALTNDDEITTFAINDSSNQTFIIQILFIVILTVIMTILIIFLLFRVQNMQKKAVNINYWDMYNTVRIPNMIEIFQTSIFAMLLNYRESNISTTHKEVNIALSYLETIKNTTQSFITENDQSDSILGIDEELDKIILTGTCIDFSDNLNFILINDCSSTHHIITSLMNIFYDILMKIEENITTDEDSKKIVELYIGATTGIIPKLLTISTHIYRVYSEYLDYYHRDILLYLFFGVVIIISNFIFIQKYNDIMTKSYNSGLVLLRRMNPASYAQNDKLLKFLSLKEDANTLENSLTVTKRIVYGSNDLIFFISIDDLIIEFVNQAVVSELSLSSDQLLGQFFSMIFDADSKEQVMPTIKMIAKNETQSITDVPVICVAADTTRIHFSLSVFRASHSSSVNKHLFAILRNMNEAVKYQKTAEKEKKRSEKLLFHILPPSIVRKLNQGEKNISMLVPSASIMFIDIVKFSDFSIALSPQQILGSLSSLCDAYDRAIANYPNLNKIKLIGDIYMCAGGLFDENDNQQEKRACEIINFGIDSLQAINDQNMKMNTNLNVRIGVNTGGPIIAGVLGTDKLQFDIIGDAINVAARLQNTGIPGQIHISEYTHSLIVGQGFHIEKRGLTFLKGKGNLPTYQVVVDEGIF